MYYFDTSALVKLYHDEEGSKKAISLFEEQDVQIYLSQIAIVEFSSSLYRKYRNREISEEKDVLQSVRRFEIDIQYENTILLDSNTVLEARDYIIKWGSRFSLKTLDAIHLACFVQLALLGEFIFISSDTRLCEIVREMGHEVINPERE
jgi:predicted nucleic acid-binding protein